MKKEIVKPKKKLGQHFLIDKNIAKKITDLLYPKSENIIELGPGTGVLTDFLIKKKINLKLVEIDNECVMLLKKKYFNLKDQIINADFLKVNINNIFTNKISLIGNFPYNISSQILFKILENKEDIIEIVGMFQKEVGERIIAKVNTKNYSRITILSNWKFNINKICEINPGSFFPKPKIKSMLLEFTPKTSYIKIKDPKNLEKLTKFFFSERRKMVKKKFKKLFYDYKNFLKQIGINETCRPQNISIENYLLIVKELEKNSD